MNDPRPRRGGAKLQLATWLIVIASLGHLVGYSVAVPEHIADTTWSDHARFHTLQALLWLIALDVSCTVVALGPFARGARWARWLLLGNLLGAHGAYFVALAAFPDGGPPQGIASHAPLAAAFALYLVGLLLGWRAPSADRMEQENHTDETSNS